MNGSLLAAPAAAPVQTYATPDFRPLWNWTISDVYDRGKFTPISENVDSNWVGKWVNIRLDHSVLLDGIYEAVMSNDSVLSETKDILIIYHGSKRQGSTKSYHGVAGRVLAIRTLLIERRMWVRPIWPILLYVRHLDVPALTTA